MPTQDQENKPEKPDQKTDDSEKVEIPEQILEAIPAEERKRVVQAFEMMITSQSRSSNPIAGKITSDHIGKIIDLGDKQDERNQVDKQRDRLFNGFIFLVCVLAVFGLIYALQSDKDLLKTIITALLAFGSGFGVGKFANKGK